MKILKVSVLVMGFLIVALTLIVIATIANRWEGTKPAGTRVNSAVPSGPYNSDIKLPVGSKIISTDLGDGKLLKIGRAHV